MASIRSQGSSFQMRVEVAGFKETTSAFKALPDDATVQLKAASAEIADTLADLIRSAGQRQGRQARKLAGTVKSSTGTKVPTVTVGGSSKLFRGRKDGTDREAYNALLGSEFGTHQGGDGLRYNKAGKRGVRGQAYGGHGFKPHRRVTTGGAASYWILSTVDGYGAEIGVVWQEAADRILRDFAQGGDSVE